MTGDIKGGVGTALAVALDQAEEEIAAEQMELLGLPEPKTEVGRQALERLRTGKPGRPPGARNKRTVKTVELLLSQHRDPRAVLLAIAEAPVEELVATLGCKPLEALQEKRLAAIGVLPYVAQRQPLAIDVTERKIVFLSIDGGGNDAGGVGLTARVVNDARLVEVDESGAPKEPGDGNA